MFKGLSRGESSPCAWELPEEPDESESLLESRNGLQSQQVAATPDQAGYPWPMPLQELLFAQSVHICSRVLRHVCL